MPKKIDGHTVRVYTHDGKPLHVPGITNMKLHSGLLANLERAHALGSCRCEKLEKGTEPIVKIYLPKNAPLR